MEMGMEKVDVIYNLACVLSTRGLTNSQRDAIRAAIATTTWLIARRAKQRTNANVRNVTRTANLEHESEVS